MVSSKDVAKKAGVSQTTVSRVLNTPELVKTKTVEKVQKAIDELNYIPNAQARSLVQNKTNTIALLSGPLHNPFFSDSTANIVQYANEKGYNVDVQFVFDEKLNEAYANFVQRRVDGVILSCILFDDPFMEKLLNLNIPFITFNRKHRNNDLFVEIDNYEAAKIASTHLAKLGHQRIAYIGGPLTVSTFNNRYEGFKDCESLFESVHDFLTDTSLEAVERVVDEILAGKKITAVLAATDSIALMVMDFLLKKGVRIPDQMSVIGIDNVDLAKHESIQLSTVGAEDGQSIGLIAIQTLIDIIEGKQTREARMTKKVRLFERNTTRR